MSFNDLSSPMDVPAKAKTDDLIKVAPAVVAPVAQPETAPIADPAAPKA